MQRQIIHIDQEKCDGCGICVPDCPEGAIQVIDGKARLISDIFCDGLGACIGNCPRGAITTEVREAEPYDEARVMENIIPQGENTIRAHLRHLNDHGLTEHVKEAVDILESRKIPVPEFRRRREAACPGGGCPGANAVILDAVPHDPPVSRGNTPSRLNHWPVQLHLINPVDPGFENADLLICADCVPFAYADFHERFVKDRRLVVFCPKLDSGIDDYIEKLATIFAKRHIRSVTIARMEVPCCGGIESIVARALEKAGNSAMVRIKVISLRGEIR
ncbi:MAG: 4Fe-4S binding protein [Candidatus Aminicenantes bacterium]|nr:4Fe-4S binding protein [Candidatus Aminicenantes bacterium]